MDDRHVAIINTVLLRVLLPLFFIVFAVHNLVCTHEKQQAQRANYDLNTINKFYFVSPMYPDLINNAGKYMASIKKKSKFVSQIRMEFIHFNLALPNSSTEICDTDALTVINGKYGDMRICGPFDDQHVVYELDNANDYISIQVNLGKVKYNRRWMIKIIQMESARPPLTGCFQYYYEAEGILLGNNYALNGRELASHPNDQICIRHIRNKCFIEYEPCNWDLIANKMNNLTMFSKFDIPGTRTPRRIKFGLGDWEKLPMDLINLCVKYKQRKC